MEKQRYRIYFGYSYTRPQFASLNEPAYKFLYSLHSQVWFGFHYDRFTKYDVEVAVKM